MFQAAGAEADNESELIADAFLSSSSSNVDDFLKDFVEKRKLAHLRRIKADKMKELISEGSSRSSSEASTPSRKAPPVPAPASYTTPYPVNANQPSPYSVNNPTPPYPANTATNNANLPYPINPGASIQMPQAPY